MHDTSVAIQAQAPGTMSCKRPPSPPPALSAAQLHAVDSLYDRAVKRRRNVRAMVKYLEQQDLYDRAVIRSANLAAMVEDLQHSAPSSSATSCSATSSSATRSIDQLHDQQQCDPSDSCRATSSNPPSTRGTNASEQHQHQGHQTAQTAVPALWWPYWV